MHAWTSLLQQTWSKTGVHFQPEVTMLDRGSKEQQYQRGPPANSSKSSVSVSSRSSTSHLRSSTRTTCITVLSNPLHPQALSPMSVSSSSSRSPTLFQHHQQKKRAWWQWPLVQCFDLAQNFRWLLLLLLCLQNLTLIGSRSIPSQSSLTDPWRLVELDQEVQLPPDSRSGASYFCRRTHRSSLM